MKECTDYEIELSAMLDGESDPATALELVGHVASCESCRAFYLEMSNVQATVDAVAVAHAPEPAPEAEVRPVPESRWRFGWGSLLRPGKMPRLAWGITTVFVVALAVWAGVDRNVLTNMAGSSENGETIIELEANKGDMDEDRFVALVTELLTADRRYQDQMYAVLSEFQDGEYLEDEQLESGYYDDGTERPAVEATGAGMTFSPRPTVMN